MKPHNADCLGHDLDHDTEGYCPTPYVLGVRPIDMDAMLARPDVQAAMARRTPAEQRERDEEMVEDINGWHFRVGGRRRENIIRG